MATDLDTERGIVRGRFGEFTGVIEARRSVRVDHRVEGDIAAVCTSPHAEVAAA
ncbi:MAG TPA: hypothetical protein VI408_03295 [Gaiellaceae bacterium]